MNFIEEKKSCCDFKKKKKIICSLYLFNIEVYASLFLSMIYFNLVQNDSDHAVVPSCSDKIGIFLWSEIRQESASGQSQACALGCGEGVKMLP